ncbi:MAG: hypothetical protein H7Z39_03595 [Burkholderiaceae bacterium]|nr:hypothetical protein [Burkholderiaceae bacterium]
MAENAVIAHQIPGRIRFRLLERRGDGAYFSELATKLGHIDAIDRVKPNPTTGSVVLEYSGSLNALIEQMQLQEVYMNIQRNPPQSSPALAPRPANNSFRLVSGRDINPLFMAASLLGIIGVVQTLRGKILVPSLSAFWYALEGFRQSKKMR